MTKDAELDRLKALQDLAFQNKQDAYQTQQRAWEKLSAARDAQNDAFEDKQRAYALQDAAWKAYQKARTDRGPRIDQLKGWQEESFQKMRAAFDAASSAYGSRAGAAARGFANAGHQHKADARHYTDERRRLVDEIQEFKAKHEATKPAFERAKAKFASAQSDTSQKKTAHEQAQAKFKQAKAEFDKAVKAFHDRLEEVRAERNNRRGEKQYLAERAGVPPQYQHDVYISRQPDGVVNIYFGGLGSPDGPGHGHYVMARNGDVTYRREPFDAHGSQNFTDEAAYIANEKAQNHGGGYGLTTHGFIEGKPVTFAIGWGRKKGHTIIADGHVPSERFRDSQYHDHYGPGDGKNSNGTLRRRYTGPGA